MKKLQIYWCYECEIPIINNNVCACGLTAKNLATDIRPVFPEEKYLMYRITNNIEFLNKSVWSRKGNFYIIKGKSVRVSLDQFSKKTNLEKIGSEIINKDFKDEYVQFYKMIDNFVEYNKQYLSELEYSAIRYIQDTNEKYNSRLPVVSFSGGKDSTVVSDLVTRALGTPSILHIYGDTTLELELTQNYVDRFRMKNNKTPFLISKSEHDFMELCETMGPPSRVMSWCCTIFKTGPLNYLINGFTSNKKILTYYGIRGHESNSRKDYQEISYNAFDKIKTSNVENSPKIAKQKVTSPIFDWKDIDVWLYILGNEIDFNDAYRLGYSRVGCWCCPNNSDWAMNLNKVYLPKDSRNWNDFLVGFAKRIGKPDAEEYVAQGKWKARQGGAGLVNKQINVEATQCVDEEYARTFNLSKPISEEIYEYFKPFGNINKLLGRKVLNEVFVVDPKTNQAILKIQGKLNSYTLKVIAVNPSNYTLLSKRVDCQLRKFQSCIGCLGCVSICPNNAIAYANERYHIQENKCTQCLQCIHPWTGGCLMTKVLAVKKGV